MTTPICDFVKNYIQNNPTRLHMPGHKGEVFLGMEKYDITEIDGADSLYEASGIIEESERNASLLFGCDTYYSTEGSSQCIKAMVYLAGLYAQKINRKRLIYAARNVHKSFISAVSLSDFEVKWLYSDSDDSYLSCRINADHLDNELGSADTLPVAVYITSPDYLGTVQDIKAISDVCKKYGVLLLCDNAHGAYLKFLTPSAHPVDLGADMCCDSAHKTLPALTGAAYLHMGEEISNHLSSYAKNALSLFGSTSPSYLILQSLDNLNKYISEGYREKLSLFAKRITELKTRLSDMGYTIFGEEILKLTIKTKSYGYSGEEIAEKLYEKKIICEFYDNDFIVLMFTPESPESSLERVFEVLFSIRRKDRIVDKKIYNTNHIQKISIRDAVMGIYEEIPVENAEGRILSQLTVACPPAVLVVSPGEIITKEDIEIFKAMGTKTLCVLKG